MKYKWVNNAAEKLIKRLLCLGTRDSLIGSLFGVETPSYLMYKVATLRSSDGCRDYEFLIEFDIYNPSQGIYFGVKSLTLPGHRHSIHIQKAMDDWERVRPLVTSRLNNLFPGVDFSLRYRDTDNANDNTFWPFWISLHENEDPEKFAVKALRVMAESYRMLIDGTLTEISDVRSRHKTVRPARLSPFTREAYDNLLRAIRKNVKISVSASDSIRKSDHAESLFERFLHVGEEHSLWERSKLYEFGYVLSPTLNDVDFNCLLRLLFDRLSDSEGTTKVKIPWKAISGVFLRADQTVFKDQFRTLDVKPSTRHKWLPFITSISLEEQL